MGLLSACLVVRDEADRIERTLDAVAPFVDEVVVHDTGSSDDTPDIARACGALVVQGTWEDSFAQARNTALDRADGDWVLSVDADEVCSGDPQKLRDWLRRVREPVLAVTVRNTGGGSAAGAAAGYEFTAVRLFRRNGARWVGRVHERVVRQDRPDDPDEVLRLVPPDLLVLEHSGYADPDAAQVKGQRNLRLAVFEIDELVEADAPELEIARAALKAGRAAIGAEQLQQAVDAFESVRELAPSGRLWAEASDYLVRVMLTDGQLDVALFLVEQLEAAGEDAEYCRWLRAQVLAQAGRAQEALRLLEGVHRIVDTASRRHDPGMIDALRELCRQLLAVT